MLKPNELLRVTVTKTADGQFDYIQIISGDSFSMNVVLIANKIELRDTRANSKEKRDA